MRRHGTLRRTGIQRLRPPSVGRRVWQHNGARSCSGQALAGAAGFGRLPRASTTAGTWSSFPPPALHPLLLLPRPVVLSRLSTDIQRLCPVEMCRVYTHT